MSIHLSHGMGENFTGPCDLIVTQLLGQLHPKVRSTPMILIGRCGFSQTYGMWSFASDPKEIGVWGRDKNMGVWAVNMSQAAIDALKTVDISDLVEEEPVKGERMFPAELPRRLLSAYPGPKDIVADPFMGRGTVGKAVLEQGGRFIGIDRVKARVHGAHEFLGCAAL